jgi:hypothetical protein
VLIAMVGVVMVVVLPFVWGLIRRAEGMPMFGAPTVADLEGEGVVATAPSGVTDEQAQVR